MRIVVAGGAGFVGSAVVRHLVADCKATVLAIDRLGAGSDLAALDPVAWSPRFRLSRVDVCDRARVAALLQAFDPDAVIDTIGHRGDANDGAPHDGAPHDGACASACDVAGWSLLASVTEFWSGLPAARRDGFRFVAAGSGPDDGRPGHMASTWGRVYGLPVIMTASDTLYGPYQQIGGLLPQLIRAARSRHPMALEGDGASARDWLHVDDHARALEAIVRLGVPGACYAIAGETRSDLAIAEHIAHAMDRHPIDRQPMDRRPRSTSHSAASPDARHGSTITFVANGQAAPARRTRLDASTLARDTGWSRRQRLETGLADTVGWYLDNEAWSRRHRDAAFDSRLLAGTAKQRRSA